METLQGGDAPAAVAGLEAGDAAGRRRGDGVVRVDAIE
jgi:hypothetical protein